MRRIRCCALALSLCLCFSACGGEGDGGGQLSPLGEAAGLEDEAVLLTVDGREVPAWRYLYWLSYACGRMEERYGEAGVELDWDAPVEGGTLAESAKAQALSDTALYATVENWAEQYGCAAPEEPEGDASVLPDFGLDEARMEELEAVGRQYAALCQMARAEDSGLTPSQEELADYGRELGAVTLDRILVSAGEDREAARQEAAALFSRLNGAADQAAEFSALAAAGDDPAGPRTVLPGDDALDASLLEAAEALEEGQISGILEAEDGFSILRRLPLDTGALRDGWFDAGLQAAASQAEITVTPAYETLDPGAFWEALSRLREGS